MIAVPAVTPATRPDDETDATAALLLDQTPPETVSEKVADEPTQMLEAPEMEPAEVGAAITVTE